MRGHLPGGVRVTTGDLIAMLRDADPDGTTPVCVGNRDVYFVRSLPAYYDGTLQQLVHDEAKRGKQWSIIGARLIRSGRKINIVAMSIADVMIDMPDLPVESCDDFARENVERWRREALEE